MSKRAIALLVAGVLAVGGGAAALAASLGGSDNPSVHTMSNGQTMTGTMSGSHTMSDGSMMSGGSMSGMDSGK